MQSRIKPVEWCDGCLVLLDQRRLPGEEVYLKLATVKEVAQAIRDMVVRGAPAIGIAAAYGVVLAAAVRWAEDAASWRSGLAADLDQLAAARPTAVNLFWALNRMRGVMADIHGEPVMRLLQEAQRIHQEDLAANLRMGERGAALIELGSRVLTHCNTGALATGGYGTALGVIRSAYAAGHLSSIFAGETRPWLQGSRLTAWELQQDGIPVTLLCEGAAASLFRIQKIDWVIVGADRIAANGDVVNKIGTYSLAVLARQHGARFMVVAPLSTVDPQVACGDDVHIEFRSAAELLDIQGHAVGTRNIEVWNPVFDLTPAEWVDVLVTEKAVIYQPDRAKIAALFAG